MLIEKNKEINVEMHTNALQATGKKYSNWINKVDDKTTARIVKSSAPFFPGLMRHKSVNDLIYREGRKGTLNKSMTKAEPGIYLIYCLADSKPYIGKSNNVRERLYVHQTAFNKGDHINVHMQNAYNKYGPESFIVRMLEVVEDQDQLSEKELYWAKRYNAHEKGFNMAPIIKGEAVNEEYLTALRGENNGNAFLTAENVVEICNLLNDGDLSGSVIAKMYKVSKHSISLIRRGKRWASLTKDYLSETVKECWNDIPIPVQFVEESLIEKICLDLNQGIMPKKIAEKHDISIHLVKGIKRGSSKKTTAAKYLLPELKSQYWG